jgi:hypothetical protein
MESGRGVAISCDGYAVRTEDIRKYSGEVPIVWVRANAKLQLNAREKNHSSDLRRFSLGYLRKRFSYMPRQQLPKKLDVADYVRANDEKALFDVLYHAQPANPHEKPYGIHYGENYNNYVRNFDEDKQAVDALIMKWVQTGHHRDDI